MASSTIFENFVDDISRLPPTVCRETVLKLIMHHLLGQRVSCRSLSRRECRKEVERLLNAGYSKRQVVDMVSARGVTRWWVNNLATEIINQRAAKKTIIIIKVA